MAMKVIDTLMDVAYALISDVVDTRLGTAVVAPGLHTVTPTSMVGIFAGCQLVVGLRSFDEEIITVVGTSATTFDAVFVNTHLNTARLVGATFPEGATDNPPLFTTAEILNYYASMQNVYLGAVRMIYTTSTQAITNASRYYSNPSDAIRIERIAIAAYELWNRSARDLSLENPNWQTVTEDPPTTWFQDMAGVNKYGFYGAPGGNQTATLWHSQSGPTTVTLVTECMLPRPFSMFMKYGILEQCFGKDGDQRSPQREQICGKMFVMGILLGIKFLKSLNAAIDEYASTPKFVPFQLPKQTEMS